MNYIKIFLLALIPSLALAAPISAPVAGEQGFATLDAAAVAALHAAVKVSVNVEEAGALYESGGRFFYTAAASNAAETSFNIQIEFPRGAKLVALYHTHPDHANNDMFSPGDVEIAERLHVRSYIYTLGADHIRRYVPGVDGTGACDFLPGAAYGNIVESKLHPYRFPTYGKYNGSFMVQ